MRTKRFSQWGACFARLWGISVLMATIGCQTTRATTRGTTSAAPGLIPSPKTLKMDDGHFSVGPKTRIVVPADDDELWHMAERLAEQLRAHKGLSLPVNRSTEGQGGNGNAVKRNTITLKRTTEITGKEAYQLEIDSSGIQVRAQTAAGMFYGVQTLRQLLMAASPSSEAEWQLPALRIEDEPRFLYRGVHLDVARRFFPIAKIKKLLDAMALYKLNTFHWHLTDDQGWRIEIKKYPRLTSVGAYRKETMVDKNKDPYVGDNTPHGGYYTHAEVRDLVAYAAERHITIVPEIEMPGHSLAALAAYPDLACTPGPFEVEPRWGIFEDIYCPTEHTFQFLENVLSEVMELFPSRYLHVGGDEAPKTRWRSNKEAQALMLREGLANEDELQSYFIQRIQRFLNQKGRRLIGWDEILEGGLAPGATVMSWRGTEGGIEAAQKRHDVIMTPHRHLYFDYYQDDPKNEPLAIGGLTPLSKVYAFDPIPLELNKDEARHILGAQANVWTEYMKTWDHVEYMVFPRLLALSEVVWSPKQARDWDFFSARLPVHYRLLDALKINYRRPSTSGGLNQAHVTR